MICPHCKGEIDYFHCIGEVNYTLEIDDFGNSSYREQGACEGAKDFSCPECNEVICETEQEAIKFLKEND